MCVVHAAECTCSAFTATCSNTCFAMAQEQSAANQVGLKGKVCSHHSHQHNCEAALRTRLRQNYSILGSKEALSQCSRQRQPSKVHLPLPPCLAGCLLLLALSFWGSHLQQFYGQGLALATGLWPAASGFCLLCWLSQQGSKQ